jgi:CheY-like chemotaxis protein
MVREIRTLKNNRKANIPIVAMTANAFEEDKKKA